MFDNGNTLPLLLLLLLSNDASEGGCAETGGCCNKNTLAMCLCLLCLMG